jgi:glycosyltransferase involved in cell wall biosynthesis
MKPVLLVAYHFPPVHGSSGLQRTLRFSEYLPDFGWQPIVLTVSTNAYEATTGSLGNEVPAGLEIHRAFAMDTARQLSIFGWYPRWLALPDRWASWQFFAVRKALQIIHQHNIGVIWSTFPIASAHSIGLELAQRTGLPWVAEFRDPMWQGTYPTDPAMNRSWQVLEQRVLRTATKVVVTTRGAAALYAERFPEFDAAKIAVIENGYDEQTFQRAVGQQHVRADLPSEGPRRITLLHSGIVYREERDPTQFFRAIAALKSNGAIDAATFQVVFRASGSEADYRRDLVALGVDDLIRLEPAIGYQDALQEMLSADGLLIFQASNCNAQIPAKLYEYIRAQRPILALTDPLGDTALLLLAAGTGMVARLDSRDDIENAIVDFLTQIKTESWPRASAVTVAGFSRHAQAGQLAQLFDSAVSTSVDGRRAGIAGDAGI